MPEAALRIESLMNEVCPWPGKPITADSPALSHCAVVGSADPGCRDRFARAAQAFEAALAARRLAAAQVQGE